ncbi:fimbrillin family protein [Sphingobacterium sp. SRCM116780]|uniref:fimbrillin family protein n=1 Tax=Sphingobacterium sp. SRCM116780 TaxID=2907623 RepID=UPI001F3A4907|nr:fimbrillin family protein [Sphingobacterium sp. SRCM116780]UIR56984.1 fimbrillin family protein [Sphingobacterium sp. SRCM116780]
MFLNKGIAVKNIFGMLILMTIFSCAKETKDKPVVQGDLSVNFQIEGIEANLDESSSLKLFGDTKQRSMDSNPKSSLKLIDQQKAKQDGQPFEAIASVYEVNEGVNFNNANASNSSSQVKKASVANKSLVAAKIDMAAGIKYRILIFDASDNFITSLDATVGTVPKFTEALRNTTYKWKAYSYNTSSTITPAIPANPTPAQLNVASSNTGGLLYASGSITTSNIKNDNNKVNILFKHQTAIIEIVFSGRGMFDRISKLTGTANIPLYSGTFNLKDGTYFSYGTPTASKSFVTTDFTSIKNDTIRSLSLYTVNAAQAISSYSVQLSELSFVTDLGASMGYANRAYTTATTGAMNYSFTKPFTPELGKRYKIIIDLLAPSRTVGGASGVDWAYWNLFYNDVTKVYGFRHYNSNFYEKGLPVSSTKSGEYFNWKAAKPGFSEATGIVDPCTLVYPAGRWKMPTQAEFSTITAIPSSTGAIPRKANARSGDPVRYINIILGTGKFSPYDGFTNGLPMLQLGRRNVGSDAMTDYNTNGSGTSGVYYWASDQFSAANANYFYITNTSEFGIVMTANNSSNLPKTNGMNIRCIRNKAFTTYTPNIN